MAKSVLFATGRCFKPKAGAVGKDGLAFQIPSMEVPLIYLIAGLSLTRASCMKLSSPGSCQDPAIAIASPETGRPLLVSLSH